MTSLTNRSNAWTGTVPLTEAINSLFEQSFLGPTWNTAFGRAGINGLALDVYEDNESYYLLGIVPGIDPGKLDLVAQDNTLTISGEVPNFVPEGKTVVWHELPAGQFRRTITLPMPFDSGKVQAQYENGMLKLVLPKAEHVRARKIEVRAEGHAQLSQANGTQK